MLAIVTGGSSGLGACIKRRLDKEVCHVIDWSLETGVDVTDKKDIQKAITTMLMRYPDGPDILINCAGFNQPEFITELSEIHWDMTLCVNAKAIWLTAKYLASHLYGGTICNIVSNASHIPMTHSIAYNASKAAAAIMTRQMAKELWQTHNITVFGVSPNKMKDTRMTKEVDVRVAELRKETSQQSKNYQLTKLLTGVETDPDVVAEFICWLLAEERRHKYLAGCIMEYGA